MWSWIQENLFTKKVLGAAIAVAGAFTPLAGPALLIGGAIFGSDFQHGAQLGTPIGGAAKDLVKQVKDVLPKAAK